MASVTAAAARELLQTLASRFDAITISSNFFPLLISSLLATKINQPPCNGSSVDRITKWLLAVSCANFEMFFQPPACQICWLCAAFVWKPKRVHEEVLEVGIAVEV